MTDCSDTWHTEECYGMPSVIYTVNYNNIDQAKLSNFEKKDTKVSKISNAVVEFF